MTSLARSKTERWFRGPLMAGFECTSYLRRDGVRLDLLAATGHDHHAAQDYALVATHGMSCVRDGIVWHRLESAPGVYNWSSLDRMVDAARLSNVSVMWDLMHFGWPDWTNPLASDFVPRFEELSARVAERVGPDAAFVPINEISFLSWACGDEGLMHPFLAHRGVEVKYALCAAFLASAAAIRRHNPHALIATAEPLIAVLASHESEGMGAAQAHESQFEALDILLGRRASWMGGSEDLIDVIGLNHYPHSQWMHPSRERPHKPRSLSSLILECATRYAHPMFLAETGAEGDQRVEWLNYIACELDHALAQGVSVLSACLYPVLSHSGWEDDRYCPNGLFCGLSSGRPVHQPLAEAVRKFVVEKGAPQPAIAALALSM